MTDKIVMSSIGFEGGKFPTHKANLHPYLLIVLAFRVDYMGRVQIEITYKGLKSLPRLLGDITSLRACIYRTSDGVALMWTKDYFTDMEMFLNPLAFEWMVKP